MLDKAIELAKSNPVEKLPRMAAIIAHRGRIVSIGFNRKKSHPLQAKYAKHPECQFLHAEIDAIRKALKKFSPEEISNFTMFVARVRKDDLPALAAPCYGCSNALKDFGIKEVYYTKDVK